MFFQMKCESIKMIKKIKKFYILEKIVYHFFF
jgi:hypothetical protein